jgi:hypothetical protein
MSKTEFRHSKSPVDITADHYAPKLEITVSIRLPNGRTMRISSTRMQNDVVDKEATNLQRIQIEMKQLEMDKSGILERLANMGK